MLVSGYLGLQGIEEPIETVLARVKAPWRLGADLSLRWLLAGICLAFPVIFSL